MRLAQLIDHGFDGQRQGPDCRDDVVGVLLLEPVPGDVVRNSDPERSAILSQKSGSLNPILVGVETDFRFEVLLDLVPHVHGCYPCPKRTKIHHSFSTNCGKADTLLVFSRDYLTGCLSCQERSLPPCTV